MEKKYFILYTFAALTISNIHLHYILADAYKQRKKCENDKNDYTPCWYRRISWIN